MYEFPCGCKFDVTNEELKDFDQLPHIDVDYYNIPLDCPATWELISTGKTQGVFQLEKHLGKKWSALIKPQELLEMSALASLIRPGTLNAMLGDRCLTQHYVDRKNGEEARSVHPLLDEILKETQGVLTYQEQSLEIVKQFAGFDLVEADLLRRALGKKDAALMTEIQTKFIKGCLEQKTCTEEEAKKIFAMIRAGERYSFNKSHGVSYGEIGYWTAYMKAHFPIHFFCAWLRMARYKLDKKNENRSLVRDAKRNDFKIVVPSILDAQNIKNATEFYIKDGKIYYGVCNVKGVGLKEGEKLLAKIKEVEDSIGKSISDWSWYEFLVLFSDQVSKTTVNNLIACGTFNHLMISRTKMLYEFTQWTSVSASKKELIKYLSGVRPTVPVPELVTDKRKLKKSTIAWECYENKEEFRNLQEVIERLLELTYVHKTAKKEEVKKIVSAEREIRNMKSVIKLLNAPVNDLEDPIEWVNNQEVEYMNTNVTYNRLDECLSAISNTTCSEFDRMTPNRENDNIIVTGEILTSREWTIKSGDNQGKLMGFLDLEDETGQINCVMFTDCWEANSHLIYEGNVVTIIGSKTDKGSFNIRKIGNAE